MALVAADLRGIGEADLVVAEADSGTVGVLLGNGDGTFGTETRFGSFDPGGSARWPVDISVGDFNGDGKTDLLVALSGPEFTFNKLAFLPGDGLGHYGSPVYTDVPGDFQSLTLPVGDFNRDGKLDVMVNFNFEAVVPFLGNGDGTFTRSQLQVDGNFFRVVTNSALGDVNEDGCLDVVSLDSYNVASVFIGNCDGTFQTQPARFPVGDVGFSAALTDLNGDGHLDLVTGGVLGTGYPHLQGNLLCVLLGDGNGNFSNGRVYRGDTSMFSLAFADLNGDGRPDVLTANQDSDSATVFLNDGTGGFGDPQGLSVGYGSGQVNAPLSRPIATDLNADRKTDLVLLEAPIYQAEPCAFQITALLNDGSGKLSDPIRSDGTDCSVIFIDYVMADFRGTGQPDFLALLENPSTYAKTFFLAPNIDGGHFGPYSASRGRRLQPRR